MQQEVRAGSLTPLDGVPRNADVRCKVSVVAHGPTDLLRCWFFRCHAQHPQQDAQGGGPFSVSALSQGPKSQVRRQRQARRAQGLQVTPRVTSFQHSGRVPKVQGGAL